MLENLDHVVLEAVSKNGAIGTEIKVPFTTVERASDNLPTLCELLTRPEAGARGAYRWTTLKLTN